ncbi:MAG: hypothetical protein AABO58_01430 [Acidobacteriota bacterium]
MLDLEAELDGVIAALTREGVEYAVCGGVAMAVHGFTRATEDLDLIVRPEDVCRFADAVAEVGFMSDTTSRLAKVDRVDGDLLAIDLSLPATEHVWRTRRVITWNDRPLSLVSREGLIALKRLRATAQDLVDIERLKSGDGNVARSIRRVSQLRKLCLSLARAASANPQK